MIPLPQKASKSGKRKRSAKSTDAADEMSGVLYVGHIPHGFYEDQMRGFFSQFGDVGAYRCWSDGIWRLTESCCVGGQAASLAV